ncbi:MAG: hypothetical protein HOP08_08125 [Cyclobacteriaceae bacterium]|nr:hypothetical protein [Cyclobacteriaceae bacterium]
MSKKIVIIFVAVCLSFFCFSGTKKQMKSSIEKLVTSDSTQYWKNKARLLEEQSHNMARLNADEAKRQYQLNIECGKQNETLRKLVDQQKNELEKFKGGKP